MKIFSKLSFFMLTANLNRPARHQLALQLLLRLNQLNCFLAEIVNILRNQLITVNRLTY